MNLRDKKDRFDLVVPIGKETPRFLWGFTFHLCRKADEQAPHMDADNVQCRECGKAFSAKTHSETSRLADRP
jgi:hypothetical protein